MASFHAGGRRLPGRCHDRRSGPPRNPDYGLTACVWLILIVLEAMAFVAVSLSVAAVVAWTLTPFMALDQHLNHEPHTSRKPLKKKELQCQDWF